MKKYWYKFLMHWCPICGKETKWKERIYDRPKPKDIEDRHVYSEIYDYCDQ